MLAGPAMAAPTASGNAPELLLEGLPRPATPPAELGPVVPSQVLRWRQEARALEHGDANHDRDPVRAAQLYCRAARNGDAEAQYSLAWMLTNARGIERDDAQAAHLFAAAAEQGHSQAQNMARTLGTPRGEPPACLRPPEADAMAQAPVRPPQPANRPAAPAVAAIAVDGPIPPNAPEPIVRFVRLVAPEYKLSPALVLAVMATESNFDPLAVSPKNAQGLMQLIPETAARFGVRRIQDPAQNIRGGMAYLRWLLDQFDGNLVLALAGYNAGENAVSRYRGIPPYAETRRYVQKIMALLRGSAMSSSEPSGFAPPLSVPLPTLRLA
ncbi:soluble lytic murein transglycosylase-like protein [Burkholderiales bacterium JOSHI_001]|nr:soluble lytic murein transglycosylase-like protein [Burkholderiales bacterium JOSHI_001]